MSDRLTNLILLAAKGMGLTQVKSLADLVVPGGSGGFYISGGMEDSELLLHTLRSWDPYASFSDAGMLMQAMGIDLLLHDRHNSEPFWEATDSDGQSNVSGRGEGNTEAAQRAAVCACALEIIKEKL